MNNFIEPHSINNGFKQENEIKENVENKEDLNTINKNIIIQNNKKIESCEINKKSYEVGPEKTEKNYLNKNFENSKKKRIKTN